jgi:hypothetical protein
MILGSNTSGISWASFHGVFQLSKKVRASTGGMVSVRDVLSLSGVLCSHETWLSVLAAAVMVYSAIRIRRLRDDS